MLETIAQQVLCLISLLSAAKFVPHSSQTSNYRNKPEFGIRTPLDGVFPEKSLFLFDYPYYPMYHFP